MTRQIVKGIEYISIFIGGIATILLTIFIIANLKDDALRPEVEQALNWQVPPQAFDKENGYVLLHGMNAPIGQDSYEAGKAILESELKRYEPFKTTNIEPLINDYQHKNPFVDWGDKQCNYRETSSCVAFYSAIEAGSFKAMLNSLAPFIERFNDFKNRKLFIEVHLPIITFLYPPFGPLSQGSELERALAVREITEGKQNVGIARLVENNLLSRHPLKNSSTLVSYLIALEFLKKDARIISELMLARPEFATNYQ